MAGVVGATAIAQVAAAPLSAASAHRRRPQKGMAAVVEGGRGASPVVRTETRRTGQLTSTKVAAASPPPPNRPTLAVVPVRHRHTGLGATAPDIPIGV